MNATEFLSNLPKNDFRTFHHGRSHKIFVHFDDRGGVEFTGTEAEFFAAMVLHYSVTRHTAPAGTWRRWTRGAQ